MASVRAQTAGTLASLLPAAVDAGTAGSQAASALDAAQETALTTQLRAQSIALPYTVALDLDYRAETPEDLAGAGDGTYTVGGISHTLSGAANGGAEVSASGLVLTRTTAGAGGTLSLDLGALWGAGDPVRIVIQCRLSAVADSDRASNVLTSFASGVAISGTGEALVVGYRRISSVPQGQTSRYHDGAWTSDANQGAPPGTAGGIVHMEARTVPHGWRVALVEGGADALPTAATMDAGAWREAGFLSGDQAPGEELRYLRLSCTAGSGGNVTYTVERLWVLVGEWS